MLEIWLWESRVRLPATSQLCFCSLIFVDYVLILNDKLSNGFFADLFGRLCSWTCAFDFSLLRCASVLYAPQSLSARARFAFVLACPVLACITLFYWSSLCSCRATVRIPSRYIRIPSSSCYRASFLTDNFTSGISCHVRRFIRYAVDNSRVIARYSLNFPPLLEW